MDEHDELDTLAIFDKDALCTYVSPICEIVTGIPQEQYLGSNWFDWTHPDDQDYCREKYDLHLNQPTTRTELNCRLVNREGDINHLRFVVSGYIEGEELTFAGVFSSRNHEVLFTASQLLYSAHACCTE